jgi:undecaprenyl diphosphate synthase
MSTEEELLLKQIDKSHLPAHVAIIMDGNGRWACKRRLPRLLGHRAGTKSVRRIVETSGALGIKVLTLYAFSTENWSRPQGEIKGLMRLLDQTLKQEAKKLDKNNVRLSTIGDISKLPQYVRERIHTTSRSLKDNTGLQLVLALNYGGRQDIVQAIDSIVKHGHRQITEELVNRCLQTASFPDPDLVIRTSGECRVSNFLLWQIAYSELVITPVLWPDFGAKDFYKAILEYQSRSRRYGALG